MTKRVATPPAFSLRKLWHMKSYSSVKPLAANERHDIGEWAQEVRVQATHSNRII